MENLRKNQMRVRFKNVIMQKWNEMKEERTAGNIQGMVEEML